MKHAEEGCARRAIVPPYILEALAERGDEDARRWALGTLTLDEPRRAARVAGAVRAGAPSRPAEVRRISTAANSTALPGTLVRSEGQPPTGDAAVDEAYDGLGATYDFYREVYGRNSIDGAGLELLATVHYGSRYDNAFFDGTEMIFGDGDGTYFNRFTRSVDVIGHELTHGVTTAEANLDYRAQPGALNESISDVFGSLVRQYGSTPPQTAAAADWLIGRGLFTGAVHGVALRSMKAPGTAYDDPVLGKDPQPAHMSGYVETARDNGGVHINSGIPNHAFYLLAVALGGHAWENAGRIWYEVLRDPRLAAGAGFAAFAGLTVDIAGRLLGGPQRRLVRDAWREVGVVPARVAAPAGPTTAARR